MCVDGAAAAAERVKERGVALDGCFPDVVKQCIGKSMEHLFLRPVPLSLLLLDYYTSSIADH